MAGTALLPAVHVLQPDTFEVTEDNKITQTTIFLEKFSSFPHLMKEKRQRCKRFRDMPLTLMCFPYQILTENTSRKYSPVAPVGQPFRVRKPPADGCCPEGKYQCYCDKLRV